MKTPKLHTLAAFFTAACLSHPALAELGRSANWDTGLQEAATPSKMRIEMFHNHLLIPIITGIVILVFALLLWVMLRYNAKANPVPSKTSHNTILEVIWTLVPVLILVVIVIPSMKLLYFTDKAKDAEMTLKITGYQWYWGYEYPDHGGINFLANLVPDKDLKPGQPRLLATDNPVVLPVDTNIRVYVTASDVIHSWAVPAFGIKTDAVQGRLNETWMRIEKEGTYYGQCSELCGTNHGFMPIEVHAVSKDAFAAWVKEKGGTMPSDAPAKTDAAVTPAATVPAAAPAEQVPADAAKAATPAIPGATEQEEKKTGE
jgi:cytochrome c oxidase subunit II